MAYPELEALIEVIRTLRDPEKGCPWDIKQTHETLLRFLIEESYEFCHAVKEEQPEEIKEELGDVLLQVILHATIAEQNKSFTLEDVARGLKEKLIHRHPHVFGENAEKISEAQVKENWDKLKAKEKGKKKDYKIDQSLLNFPALFSADKIGRKTSKLNFDWENYYQVTYKVEEEWQELKEELPPQGKVNKKRAEEELGDLLFSVAQLARHLEINPEEALRKANSKFISRFNKIEDFLNEKGLSFEELEHDELEEYWVKVKNYEKQT